MTSNPPRALGELLKPDFEPASNARDHLAFADERYLLPRLDTGRALHLGLSGGVDSARFMERLPAGARLTLLSTNPGVAKVVSRREPGTPDVRTQTLSTWSRLPVGPGSAALAVVGAGEGAPGSSDFPRLAIELRRVVGEGGAVVFKTTGYGDTVRARKLGRSLTAAGFTAEPVLWLLSISGSLRIAMEEDDLGAAQRLLEWLGRGTSVRRRAFRIGIDLLDRLGLLGAFLARQRLFLFRATRAAPHRSVSPSRDGSHWRTPAPGQRAQSSGNAPPADDASSSGSARPSRSPLPTGADPSPENASLEGGLWPPPYLQSVLAEAGIDPDRYRVGFHAHGRYDSNKVAFVLFDRDDGGEPRHLVKITRAPTFNYRLENEHRCLEQVKRHGYLPQASLPEVTFLTHHAGLVLLGMRFVPGRPMREVSAADPECPWVRRVVDRLETLGASSAQRDPGVPGAVREGLGHLHRRFLDLYPLPDAEGSFLQRQVEALLDGVDKLPVVFQHGDPGIWNVLADDRDPVLLDWEAGEPAGLPLWDLFYFLRSVGTWQSKLRGDRDPIRSYQEHFLSAAPLARFQAQMVKRYRLRLGIAEEVVEPLFYTCWVYRALREAMQMVHDAVEEGIYYRLLRRSIRLRGMTSGVAAS